MFPNCRTLGATLSFLMIATYICHKKQPFIFSTKENQQNKTTTGWYVGYSWPMYIYMQTHRMGIIIIMLYFFIPYSPESNFRQKRHQTVSLYYSAISDQEIKEFKRYFSYQIIRNPPKSLSAGWPGRLVVSFGHFLQSHLVSSFSVLPSTQAAMNS